MMTRRLILAAAASAIALGATATAQAGDWKAQYPELTFALVPAENAADTNNRWQPMMDHLSKKLGVKVTLRIVNDYAAVIEGQKAGNIHIALYGPASYARLQDRRRCFSLRNGSREWRNQRLSFSSVCEERFALQEARGSEGQACGIRRPEFNIG